MFYSEQTLRVAIRETPEGRAYYPWNTGDGYLIDAPTERRLARFLDGYFFGQILLLMPFMIWGSETGHWAIAMVAFVTALMAIRHLCLRRILRGAPRVHARFDKAEALRRAAADFSFRRIGLLGFILVLLPLGLVLAAKNEDRWDFAVLTAMYVAMTGWGVFVCVRLLRAKTAMGRSSKPRNG